MLISDFLKAETRHLHDLTEAKFNSDRLFKGDFSKDDYIRLLLHNHALLSAFESSIFSKISEAIALDLDLRNRSKLHLVEADLQHLNISVSTQNIHSIENPEEAWGLLYVMEGATIGGTMMAKQLSAYPEFQDFPFHYFRIYGDKTGSKWKKFKEVIDREIPETSFPVTLAGANRAYRFLLDFPL